MYGITHRLHSMILIYIQELLLSGSGDVPGILLDNEVNKIYLNVIHKV